MATSEARFLASRAARYGAHALKPSRYESTTTSTSMISSKVSEAEEELDEWKRAIRSLLSSWLDQLGRVGRPRQQQHEEAAESTRAAATSASSCNGDAITNEDAKRRIAMELDRMRLALDDVKHRCVELVMVATTTADTTADDATTTTTTTVRDPAPPAASNVEEASLFSTQDWDKLGETTRRLLHHHPTSTTASSISSDMLQFLHDRFASCYEQYHAARTELLPRGKFVFARYRAFVRDRQHKKQQQQKKELEPGRNGVPSKQQQQQRPDDAHREPNAADSIIRTDAFQDHASSSSSASCSLCVENVSHVRAVLDSHRVVVRTSSTTGLPPSSGAAASGGADPSSATAIAFASSPERSSPMLDGDIPAFPVVVRNVAHSVIDLQGQQYPSVHAVRVQHSTLTLQHGVPRGAIHVTNCHHLTLHVHGPIQQLRMHESSHVDVHLAPRIRNDDNAAAASIAHAVVAVTGGIILEGCSAVTFHVHGAPSSSSPSAATSTRGTLDVKDFSFLKRGVPSPNYAVLYHRSSNGIPTGATSPGSASLTLPLTEVPTRLEARDSSAAAVDAAMPTSQEHSDVEEEDDDDEL
jgi:Tubulin binding cofactor C